MTQYAFASNESFKKVLSILALSFAMLIFSAVVLIKVDVWAQKQEAEVRRINAELDWEGYLYQKAARNLMK
jgi:hypothetical protein